MIEVAMHVGPIDRIGVSADGRILVTGAEDKTVRLRSLPDGRLLKTLRVPIGAGNGSRIYSVAISPDGRLVAAAGWDANIPERALGFRRPTFAHHKALGRSFTCLIIM